MEVEIDANDTVKAAKKVRLLRVLVAVAHIYSITSATCSCTSVDDDCGRDDIWALFASVALVIHVVAIFLHIPPPNSLSYTTRIAGAARQLLIPLLG
ncbi:hypothetical protein B0H14DRAFT_3023548 [Mycena olivaceomarginata]|nr:hypothetical protein B0H14DRAFT_3023548 [Mycena olivaceomarginata]